VFLIDVDDSVVAVVIVVDIVVIVVVVCKLFLRFSSYHLPKQ